MSEIPYVNPDVQYIRVTKLRRMNATNLSSLEKICVIQAPDDKPVAVLIPYEQYMSMQDWLISLTIKEDANNT